MSVMVLPWARGLGNEENVHNGEHTARCVSVSTWNSLVPAMGPGPSLLHLSDIPVTYEHSSSRPDSRTGIKVETRIFTKRPKDTSVANGF